MRREPGKGSRFIAIGAVYFYFGRLNKLNKTPDAENSTNRPKAVQETTINKAVLTANFIEYEQSTLRPIITVYFSLRFCKLQYWPTKSMKEYALFNCQFSYKIFKKLLKKAENYLNIKKYMLRILCKTLS